MVQVGAGKINRRPCTEAEQFRNWSITTQNFENISILLQEGAGGDTYKVAVNAADVGNATPDYLHAKIDQANVPDATKCAVRSVTVGDLTELLYWSAEDISGYGDTGFKVMSLSGGELIWSEIATDIDDKTVKVTASDSTSSFLHDAFHLNATYVGGADLLIATETVGSGGTDQKERLSVDVSIISGWHASEFRVLGILSNVSQYFTITDIGTNLFSDSTFVNLLTVAIEETYAKEKYRAIRGRATTNVSSEDATFFITSVEPLASGLDPTNGNGAATVEVYNFFQKRFSSDDWVQAIYAEEQARWETFKTPNDGEDGSSGTFVCTLTTDINPCSGVSTMGVGEGTVYEVLQGGGLNELGTRAILNPFKYELPSAGGNAHYPCARTYQANPLEEETEGDDEFTIVGIDVMYLLAHLGGFAPDKVLFTTGTSIADIGWAGGDC